MASYILQEDSSKILLEDGSGSLLIESVSSESPSVSPSISPSVSISPLKRH